MNFQEIWNEAHQEASKKAYKEYGMSDMIWPCGFAWVNIKPANSAFAKWIIETKKGSKDSYYKGVTIWISIFNQSMNHKEAYAQEMASIFKSYGIDATAYSRID